MFNNQRGAILIPAMVVVAVAALLAGTIASQTVSTNQLSQLPRVRAIMSQTELKVRSLAYSPATYLNCDSNIGPSSCQPNVAAFTNLSSEFVVVTVQSWTPNTLTLSVRVAANSDRNNDGARDQDAFSFAPRDLVLVIPSEILQSTAFQCPTNAPVFTGFNSQGQRQCAPIPATRCGAGEYVASIDRNTLQPTCLPAGPDAPVGCWNNQPNSPTRYVSQFTWTGTVNASVSCASRQDPFALYSFSPQPSYGASTSSRDIPDPTPNHPLPPATFTWTPPQAEPAYSCPIAAPVGTPTPTPTATPACVPDGGNLGGYVCPSGTCRTTTNPDPRCCSGTAITYGVPVGEQGDIDCGSGPPPSSCSCPSIGTSGEIMVPCGPGVVVGNQCEVTGWALDDTSTIASPDGPCLAETNSCPYGGGGQIRCEYPFTMSNGRICCSGLPITPPQTCEDTCQTSKANEPYAQCEG